MATVYTCNVSFETPMTIFIKHRGLIMTIVRRAVILRPSAILQFPVVRIILHSQLRFAILFPLHYSTVIVILKCLDKRRI